MAMSTKAENRVRRWREQRWLLDTVVSQVGVEFDQARIAYTAGVAGPEALAEFRMTAMRVRKINDIDREFAAAAARTCRIGTDQLRSRPIVPNVGRVFGE